MPNHHSPADASVHCDPAATAGGVRIRLLGSAQLLYKGRTLGRISPGRSAALLALLIFRSPNPIPREVLLESLWPNTPGEVAQNRLRVLLSSLRVLLRAAGLAPDGVLAASRSTVELTPGGSTSDVHEFHSAVAAARAERDRGLRLAHLETALQVYGGDLLPGYYDDWILTERSQLSAARFQAQMEAALLLEEAGSLDAASERARQAVAAEPLDEEAHCLLIRLYARMRQPSAALRQFDQLRAVLWDEVRALPSAGARQLAASIARDLGHAAPSTRRAIRPVGLRPTERAVAAHRRGGAIPVQLSRFFGRAVELEQLSGLLSPNSGVRLVTLLGPGGIGKTRLAVQVAESLNRAYRGRVFFVGLADLFDPRDIGRAVAQEFGIPPSADTDPLSQAMSALGDEPALMVMDNAEQLLPDATSEIQCLLSGARAVSLLVTSRRSTGIDGEQELWLGPLPVPPAGADARSILDSAGVRLFANRASAIRPDFALSEQNAAIVAELCRSLQGVPLSIELAAARIRSLSVSEMLQQTGGLLSLLVDPGNRKIARHRSIRSALEWSYGLLSQRERVFLSGTAVFSGGFTAASAAYVCAAAQVEAISLLDRLQAASLIQAAQDEAGRTRFSMLQPVREFCAAQLAGSGLECETRRRHLECYALATAGIDRQSTHPDGIGWRTGEGDNYRAALEFGLRPEASSRDRVLALRLAAGLVEYWTVEARWIEGRAFLQRALAAEPCLESARDRMLAASGAASLAILQGELAEAARLAEAAMEMARQAEDLHTTARSLQSLGMVAFHRAEYARSEELHRAALALFSGAGCAVPAAECLCSLGNCAFFRGDHAAAQALLQDALGEFLNAECLQGAATALARLGNVLRNQGYYAGGRARLTEALRMFREIGSRQGVATALHDLGLAAALGGDPQEARHRYEDALAAFREIGNRRGYASALVSMAQLNREGVAAATNEQLLTEALAICRSVGDRRMEATCLLEIGTAAAAAGDPQVGEERMLQALRIEQEIGSRGGIGNCALALGHLALQRRDLPAARAMLRQALRHYAEMNARPNVGHAMIAVAALERLERRPSRAAEILGAAGATATATAVLPPVSARLRERLLAELSADLGEQELKRALEAGASLSAADAAALALMAGPQIHLPPPACSG